MHEVLAWIKCGKATERPAMTIAVELGRKATKNPTIILNDKNYFLTLT